MTESEAIKLLKYYDEQPWFLSGDQPAAVAFKMAIQALEEIQAYRTIGLSPTMVKDLIASCKKHEKNALENAHIVDEYRAIGTVEEFKTLKEKAEPKKPIEMQPTSKLANGYSACPICGAVVGVNDINGDYCHKCGQRLKRQ